MSTLKVNIGANLSQLEKSLQTAQQRLRNFGTNLKQTGRTLSTRLTAPIAAFSALTVKAFAEQEKAELQLRAALKANGRQVDSLFNSYNSFAKEMQRVTVVGDEVTLSMLSQAESLGLTGDAAQRAVKNSIAMQSAFGVNAQSALRYTAALEQGNSTMLARYIPALRDIEGESARVAKAQEILGRAFSAAESEAQSASGQLQQMKNAFGDFMEIVGGVIAEAILPFVKRLKELSEMAQQINPRVVRMGVVVAGLVAAIGPALFILGQMAIAISALISPIGLAIAAVGALGVAFIHVQQNWEGFKERFSDVAWLQNALIDMIKIVNKLNPFQMLIDAYNALAGVLGMPEIKSAFEENLDAMKMEVGEFDNDISSLKDSLIGFAADIAGIDLDNPFKVEESEVGGASGGGFMGAMSGGIDRVAMQYESARDRVFSAMEGIRQYTVDKGAETTEGLSQMSGKVSQIAQAIEGSINSMASGFVEDMALMATGSQSVGTLVTNVMKSLADLAVRVGKIAIAVGIGVEGIKKALQSLNPVAAIAAGVALIALGTAAKSALSSAGSGGGGGSSVDRFRRTATSVPSASEGGGTVTFRIGNKELVGVLQQGSKIDSRVGKRVGLQS